MIYLLAGYLSVKKHDSPPVAKPMAAPKEEVPSDIADKLQTMKNNRAAKNYTKRNPSGYAGVSFDKD